MTLEQRAKAMLLTAQKKAVAAIMTGRSVDEYQAECRKMGIVG